MGNIDFSSITACGESCIGCKKKDKELCSGCIETDGNCQEWSQSKGCPICKCAIVHNVQFCGLCNEFPCELLINKITWNTNAVEHLRNLANLYYNQKKQ